MGLPRASDLLCVCLSLGPGVLSVSPSVVAPGCRCGSARCPRLGAVVIGLPVPSTGLCGVRPHSAPPFMLLAGCGGADVPRVAFTAADPAVRGTLEVAALVCPPRVGGSSGGSTCRGRGPSRLSFPRPAPACSSAALGTPRPEPPHPRALRPPGPHRNPTPTQCVAPALGRRGSALVAPNPRV